MTNSGNGWRGGKDVNMVTRSIFHMKCFGTMLHVQLYLFFLEFSTFIASATSVHRAADANISARTRTTAENYCFCTSQINSCLTRISDWHEQKAVTTCSRAVIHMYVPKIARMFERRATK